MVVFPSWLPFFLTQSPQDAKQNAAQRNATHSNYFIKKPYS